MNRRKNTSFVKINHLQLIIASLAIIIHYLNCVVNTDNFTADVAQQTTKACVFMFMFGVLAHACSDK